MVCPGPKLRLEASGTAPPVGYAVRYEPAVGSVAVRFTTTAETPVLGTPPWPVACTSMLELEPTGLCVPRVSRIRAGVSALYLAPAALPSEYQPTTSAMKWVYPCAL